MTKNKHIQEKPAPSPEQIIEGYCNIERSNGLIETDWQVFKQVEGENGERNVIVVREVEDEEGNRVLQRRIVPLDSFNTMQSLTPDGIARHNGSVHRREKAKRGEFAENPMPIVERELAGENGNMYRAMFHLPDAPEGMQGDERRYLGDRIDVLPDDIGRANDMLEQAIQRDEYIGAIVAEFVDGPIEEGMLPALIRSNDELRATLGVYFLKAKIPLLDGAGQLPDRIHMDDERKNPNHHGYDSMPRIGSRVYAALLAVSMLDGTFKADRAKGDPIVLDGQGIAQRGQHRYTAYTLLGLKAPEMPEIRT